ncbi:hypothetical protein EDB85DRAFT_1902869 [Lactarius pseudohatsudake]|nr:hypothetical protein EDB85DRAFT_1902869 [Lactarius pseudohatsudake]
MCARKSSATASAHIRVPRTSAGIVNWVVCASREGAVLSAQYFHSNNNSATAAPRTTPPLLPDSLKMTAVASRAPKTTTTTATPLKWRPQGDDQDLHLQDDYRGTTTNPPQNCDVGDNAVTSHPHTPPDYSFLSSRLLLRQPPLPFSLQNSIDTPFLPTGVLPTPDVASKIESACQEDPNKGIYFIVEMKTFSLIGLFKIAQKFTIDWSGIKTQRFPSLEPLGIACTPESPILHNCDGTLTYFPTHHSTQQCHGTNWTHLHASGSSIWQADDRDDGQLVVLTRLTKMDADYTPSEGDTMTTHRIKKSREFVSEGQTMERHPERHPEGQEQAGDKDQDLIAASKELQNPVRDDGLSKSPSTEKLALPKIFIVFDKAHPLTSHFVELRRALRVLSDVSLFTFFLSTIGKISQFSPPRGRDASHRMNDGELKTPTPFIYLGFDQLMRNRKVFDKYKTLDDVTSLECIAHMGRPLWGTTFDHGDDQRLPLDINSTIYVPLPSDQVEKEQEQISNHMRVCMSIEDGIDTIRGIAASEPILAEVASLL